MSKLTQEEADLEASLSSAPTEVAEFAEQDGGLIVKRSMCFIKIQL